MSKPNFLDLDYLSNGKRPFFILAILIIFMALVPAINLQPLDRDESRFMQATTQMFETNDYVRISFQDEARNKKPVGIHWMQAAVVKSLGQERSHNPFFYRIVSLLGAYLAVVATFLLGKILFERKTALFGAIMLATSLLMATEAHIAKTDAALTGFIALSFFALGKLRFEGRNLGFNLLFWGAFAIAFLIKGPVPLMVIFLMLALFYFWDRDFEFVKSIFDIRGILLFIAIAIPWYVLIAIKTNGQFYIEALGKDLGEKISGKQENPSMPPGLHTLISPILLWPWSLFIGAGILVAIKEFKDAKIKFLLAIIIPTWLVFEISTGKLAHYTMPVHFAIALLMAHGVLGDYLKGWAKIIGIVAFGFASILVLAIAPYLAMTYDKSLYAIALPIAVLIFLALVVGAILIGRKRVNGIVAFACAAIIFSTGVKGFLLPQTQALNISERIANHLAELGINPINDKNKPALIGAGYQEPSLIFLTRTDSHLANIETAAKFAKPDSPYVVEEGQLPQFSAQMAKLGFALQEKSDPIKGVNYSKGDDVIIHIGVLTKANAP